METGVASILTEGHPALSAVAAPVAFPDAALTGELARLHATLADFRARRGFGRAMAAPQIGLGRRIVVMNLGATPFALINPAIVWRSEERFEVWDDCLSIPDRIVRVQRYRSVSVLYRDERGRERRWDALPADLAELVQHEVDHLDGILMTARAHGPDAVRPIAEHAALIGSARPSHRLSLASIARSVAVIDPVFLNSPQYDCEPLSEALGCRLTIKLDFTNPIRSFKGRGASFFVRECKDQRPFICASAGNWGQAMAYACRSAGRSLVVYASVNASPMKVERMLALGADVRRAGEDFDAAKDAARATGGYFVEDGLEPAVSEGHGTLACELLADGAIFDAMTIPLGNGAMLNGMARWSKAASPATRIFGVCAAGAPSMERSWRSGAVSPTLAADTIADGIAVREPIPEAVADMHGIVDDVLLIDDTHIVEAMRLVRLHAGLLVEPAGAVGVAAILAHSDRFAGRRVATVLCGSNAAE